MSKHCLIEIGTEELPPKSLTTLITALQETIGQRLKQLKLNYQRIDRFATPRRLALLIYHLDEKQSDQKGQRKGPAMKAAYDTSGNPSKALVGFAKSCQAEIKDLQTLTTNKGDYLVFNQTIKGQQTVDLLPQIIRKALNQLPIAKRMRWGNNSAEFVRPVKWLTLLLGRHIVNCEILNVQASNKSYGHRFHHPDEIIITHPEDYPSLLLAAYVECDFDKRRKKILHQVDSICEKLQAQALYDDALLDEITALVEWPVSIVGEFEEKYLKIPAEVLVSTMQSNQKYFSLTDKNGKLLAKFITIANLESKQPELIQAGNERVIRPRLADADFFWRQDKKIPLNQRIEALKQVVFQQKLGTLWDKSQRVQQLCQWLCQALDIESQNSERAAILAKCDLLTEMVGEFPALQGIMGRYYAQHDNENHHVCQAIDEQYKPRFAGDSLATTTTGQVLALAERIDTLSGIFLIQQIPTGDKDPFALRRAALGIVRTLIECGLDIDLKTAIKDHLNLFPAPLLEKSDNKKLTQDIYDFILDRLQAYYNEQGISADLFHAVKASNAVNPLDFQQRIQGLKSFSQLDQAKHLVAANKRVKNILKKTKLDHTLCLQPALFIEVAEKALYQHLKTIEKSVETAIQQRNYQPALASLAQLQQPVDDFFDQVIVMSDDIKIRNNRLLLLQKMTQMFLQIADVSRI